METSVSAKGGKRGLSVMVTVVLLAAGGLSLAAGPLITAQPAPAPAAADPPQVTLYLDVLEKTFTVLGTPFTAWTYGGTVPGPTLRIVEGTEVTVVLRNAATEPHSFHTHFQNYELASDGSSMTAPFAVVPHQNDDPLGWEGAAGTAMRAMDGMGVHANLQTGVNPIGPYDPRGDNDVAPPGGVYTYKFLADEPGILFYHCHVMPAKEHIERGLFGLIEVYPKGWSWVDLPKDPLTGNTKAWVTDANGKLWYEDAVVISELDPTTVFDAASVPTTGPSAKLHLGNFKAWNDPYVVGPVKTGQDVRLLVADIGDEVHTWHVHGHHFNVLDKFSEDQRVLFRSDAMLIGPGESFATTLKAGKPGWWFMHDHVVPDAYAGMVPWLEITP